VARHLHESVAQTRLPNEEMPMKLVILSAVATVAFAVSTASAQQPIYSPGPAPVVVSQPPVVVSAPPVVVARPPLVVVAPPVLPAVTLVRPGITIGVGGYPAYYGYPGYYGRPYYYGHYHYHR
jgi:hypothetical protein